MRKRGGNLLKKAMAVLLSVVLCVGLVVGAEPVKVRAEGVAYQFKLAVLGENAVDAVESVTLWDRTSAISVKTPTQIIQDGVITYEVTGVSQGNYIWQVRLGEQDGGDYEAPIFPTVPLETYCAVWFKDGDTTLYTRYARWGTTLYTIPNSLPSKEEYDCVGWQTEDGVSFNSSYVIQKPVNIYPAWVKKSFAFTDKSLAQKVLDIFHTMPISNDITQESVRDYIKREADEYYQIDLEVEITSFNLINATSDYAGSLSLSIVGRYGYVLAGVSVVNMYIPRLSPEADIDWALDEAGNLTIISQEGMNDWVQNGRLKEGNVSGVKNVVIQDGVTEIPDNAFSGCSNLETLTIPNSVMEIGDSAFAGSSSLSEVTLPTGLNSIGNSAFSGCSSLEKVVMQGETPPSIGNSVFDGCKFVEEPENTEGIVVPPGSGDAYKGSAGGFSEYIKEQPPECTEEALGGKLQEILDNLSVSNDTTEEEIRVAVKEAIYEYFQIDSVPEISSFDLKEATAESDGTLEVEVFVESNGVFAKRNVTLSIPQLPLPQDRGWTLDENGTLTITSPGGMEDWIQNGRTEDGNLSDVKQVVIEDGVTEIPDNAFSGCGNLKDVSIPDSVIGIGDSAFAGNVSLGSVVLPQNLKEIGDGAFSSCSALDRVVMQGTEPPVMGNAVFDQCKFVEDKTEGIIVPEGSEEKYKAVWGDSLGEYIPVNPPAVTEEILRSKLQEVFDGLVVTNDTTETDVRDKIKAALEDYFQTPITVQIAYFKPIEATADTEGALSLTIIAQFGERSASTEGTIPIAKLPDRGWALDDAGNLTLRSQAGMDDWVQTGKSETDIRAIKNLVIQGDVTVIPDNAFKSCNNLETVTIPETVTNIGNSAFAFVSSLASVTLPQGLQRIGNEAFLGCDSLEKVVMQGSTPPSIGESVFEQCKFSVGNANKGIVVPTESVDAYKEAWGGELGKYIAEKHVHNYLDEWVYDKTSHWHECVSCDVPGNKASHAWNDGDVILESTETEAGIMGYNCSVCGSGKTELIPASGTPSASGNMSSASGNGNGNQGGDTSSVSGNGNQGGDIPSVSDNGYQGSGTPSTPDSGNQGSGGDTTDKDKYQPPENKTGTGNNTSQPESNNDTYGISQNADTAAVDTSWTPEPSTGDGISTMMYATMAMILGFTYLILLFSERHGMTEETKKELLSRLVGWTKCGSKLRRMLARAGIFLLLAYYHSIGKKVTEEEETSLTVWRKQCSRAIARRKT